MTGSKVNQLRFDISEKVRLHPQQPGIGTLLELDLYPDVEVEDQGTHLKIHGYLRLNGTYQPEQTNDPEADESGRAEAFGKKEEIAYVIPVEITLPAERVDVEQIASEIHSFDYQVLSPFELRIEALLTIDGLIQEEREEEQSMEAADSVPTFSVPSGGDIRWKQDAPGDSREEKDEYEFVHVARLEESEDEPEGKESREGSDMDAEEAVDPAMVENQEEQAEVEQEEQEEREVSRKWEETETDDSHTPPVTLHPIQSDREVPPLSRSQTLRLPHMGEFDFQHFEEDERTRFGIERLFEEKQETEPSSKQTEPVPEEAEEMDSEPVNQEEQSGSRLEWAQWMLGEDQERFVKLRMVIVQKEDSIDSLSDRYEVPASKIVHLNRLESEVLQEGQIVYIPSK